jgi:hypothetical protein
MTYAFSRSLHLLRQRNINAPVCPNALVCPFSPTQRLTQAQVNALRPDPTRGNVYQMESSGYSQAQMLAVGFRSNLHPRINLNGGYTLSFAEGDTDSLSSPRFVINSIGFPAYSYDLSNEYAPSAFNARHSLFLVGSVGLPLGFRLNTILFASTGRRFNITAGEDRNYDALFFERPTFAQLANRCQELGLTESYCDIAGQDPNAIIPRNYGRGPGSFNMNMNLSKTFGFGGSKNRAAAASTNDQPQPGAQTPGNRGGGGGNRRAGGGGGGGPVRQGGGGPGGFFGGGGDTGKPYNLTLGVNVQNIFNTVNLSTPVGSLTSPSFGRSRSTGGGFGFFGGGGGSANRRVDLTMRFSW